MNALLVFNTASQHVDVLLALRLAADGADNDQNENEHGEANGAR